MKLSEINFEICMYLPHRHTMVDYESWDCLTKLQNEVAEIYARLKGYKTEELTTIERELI